MVLAMNSIKDVVAVRGGHPIKTLLVDDHRDLLSMLKSVFEESGFKAVAVGSAREAVAALAKQTFEIVVTDIRMETPTAGFEVIRAAKARVRPPVIAILSAFPLPRHEWRRAGADAFILKGPTIADRIHDLRAMAERRRQTP